METDIAIIGAGVTGLCCSYYLNSEHLVFEKSSSPGGVCKTENINGFLFDYAEHFIRVPNDEVKNFLERILGDKLFSQALKAKIFIDGKVVPYPFQKNIYYLSNKDKKKCLLGYLERQRYSGLDDSLFGNWFYKNYGQGISDIFMYPYNKKIWCVEPNEMRSDFSFDPKLIPEISLDEMLDYCFFPQEERAKTDNSLRYYFKGNGISELSEALAKDNKRIVYNKEVERISSNHKTIYFSDGTSCKYNKLISTIPINLFVSYFEDIPEEIHNLSKRLRYNSVYILNIALNKKIKFDFHWMYVPEEKYQFSRLYSLGSFSPNMTPEGKNSLSVLTTYLPEQSKGIDKDKMIKQILQFDLFSMEDIEFIYEQNIEYGFTIPTIESINIVRKILDFFYPFGIISIGRYGEWRYVGIEHAIIESKGINELIS